MDTPTISKVVLGSLILRTSLIESSDLLTADLFSSPRERRTFELITAMYEDGQPEEIDRVLLISKLGGDGVAAFVASLTDGLQHLSNKMFIGRILELRKKTLTAQLLAKIERQAKAGVLDLDEIRPDLDAIDALRSDHAGPPHMVLLSSVEAQPVEWLWPNFIPLGKATMISGDPNVGKTFFMLDVAARLSRGLPWPDGSPGSEPANAIYFTVEDQAKDTLRPRIDSLGGDPSKVGILNPICSDFVTFAEKDGIHMLEQDIIKLGNVHLVVLDPIIDFSGEVNPNAAEQVRAFLTPLIRLAEKLNFALVLIAHLNKAQSQSAIYRTGGSTSAWLGKCRAAFMIFKDTEEKKKRYVSAIKSNLAADDPPQLSFVPNSGRLVFETVVEEVDVDEQINPLLRGQGAEKEERSFAVKWLKDALKAGPVVARELRQAAREAGITESTLLRTAHKLNLEMKSEGFGKFKTSSWSLREEEADAQ
jgi:hypothetical protein